jgi:CzcA family heavy metal efflux pump
MLNKIIKFSLKNRLLIVASAALLMVYGTYVALNLPVDVLPDLNRPRVTIMSEASGLSPEEVEILVTVPIENVLNGSTGVKEVRSSSAPGLSVVYVEFDWETDILIARQLVSEKLQTATEKLPEGVTPIMAPISSIMGQIMLIGLYSTDTTSSMDVRTAADWVIRPRLLTIPGVSQVISIGGEVKQYQVLVDPHKMASLNVSIEEVENSLKQSNVNTTGGFTESSNKEFLIRNIGRTESIEEISNSVITYRDNIPILLRQVGEVKLGAALKRGDAGLNGKPAVILSIEKQPDANTITLTEEVTKALDEIQASLPPGIKIEKNVFRQADFIEASIGNVEEALRDGAIIVAIVLFLFLLNFRTTVITLTAIPLSFIITALIFKFFDLSINTMTLGGLAVAIGELVDDAIVDVENVFRRLRENRQKENPEPVLVVIFKASSEIRNSIVYATIIVVLVFIPLFYLSGIEGRIFTPLGLSYIISISASLLVSLTVTPVLCSYLLPKAKLLEHKEGFLVRWLKKEDTKLLKITLRHPKLIMSSAAFLVVISTGSILFMGSEFLPAFNEGSYTVNVFSPPGTSLTESNRIGTIAEKLILKVPEVVSTGRRTGRAELDEHAEGVHYTEVDVVLKESDRDREFVLQDVRNQLSKIPGVSISVGQPISHRIDHLLSGVRAQIAVKLYGTDLSELRRYSAQIEKVMGSVEGIVDLQVEKQVLIPQLRIKINREAAAKYGFTVGNIAEVLETSFNGEVVSQVLDEQKTFDMVIRYDDRFRDNIQSINSALLDSPTGKIPITAVAEILEDKGPNVINRENMQRRIVVQANVSGEDLGTVVENIQEKISTEVKLPQGYFVTYGGQFESQQSASRLILLLSIFSFGVIFLVLYMHFKSAMIVAQVLLSIPLALIGSVVAVYLTGGVMSIATLVGFVTLTGIASRNGIMMISHYLHLIKEEGENFSKHMIIRGSLERLVPVLMTASATALALIPLILAAGQPGKEILYPVAVVIFGGLISSTLLDIIVTPAVFYVFGEKAVKKYSKEIQQNEISDKNMEIAKQ